jgi:hypothetical protein
MMIYSMQELQIFLSKSISYGFISEAIGLIVKKRQAFPGPFKKKANARTINNPEKSS